MPSLIVWDVDDVLNRLMYCWLDNWNQNTGSNIHYEEIIENPPHKILDITKKDYLFSLDTYRNTKFGRNVSINKNVFQWFQSYGKNFMHIVCTARTVETMPNQSWWVFTYFGKWIHSIVMASSLRNNFAYGGVKTKAEYIAWLNKDVIFVDDSENNVNEVSKMGGISLLFPQPWNRNNQSEIEFFTDLNRKLGL